MPLADFLRPKDFDDVVGQKHLLSKNAPFRRIIESENIPSLLFYGPPGTGKTTVADIIAKKTGKIFHKLNATVASLSDVRDILNSTDSIITQDGVVLYIDEIQYFNKKQQQSLLEYMEDGRITLICSTTENPYFCIYNALLSRTTIFEFKSVSPEDILISLRRSLDALNTQNEMNKTTSDKVLDIISHNCGGDVRKAIGTLENTYYASIDVLQPEIAKELSQRSGLRFDRDGDSHYDLLSAFQKSIRGSDADASIYYLARILEGGDLLSACRRLMVIASEDIGLAYPLAAVIVKSCIDSALQLGLPEASIPLSQAVLLLATSPKSNSAINAYSAAVSDIANGEIPQCLRDTHYPGADKLNHTGYKYPHNYPNSYIEQQYLPDTLINKIYYVPGNNRAEDAAKEYWRKIKKN
ncbi:MAG: hypothetical protein A2Y17_03170 [Clostridiales bacterium GWF2_38_85]|nr:MAG: hypothetical protein A2Y17_03170 [Clostridiales bacterium GWF2_38_85]